MAEIKTADLAAEVGVVHQRISQWEREGLREAAKLRRGWFDREKALEWIETRRSANARESKDLPEQDVGVADIVAARVRLYNAQGDGALLRNAILRGELITRELVEAVLSELGVRLLQPLDEWVRGAGSSAQIARNKEAADDFRRELVRAIEDVRRTLDAGEDLGPTRVRLPRRVGG